MKRITTLSLLLLLLLLVALLAIKLWPSQSDSSKALSLIRESCGLEEVQGRWEFNNEKSPTRSFEDLSQDERIKLESATRKNAISAQRAAFLDSRWLPLADALVVVNNDQALILGNRHQGNTPILVDSRLKIYYKCIAVRDESNS